MKRRPARGRPGRTRYRSRGPTPGSTSARTHRELSNELQSFASHGGVSIGSEWEQSDAACSALADTLDVGAMYGVRARRARIRRTTRVIAAAALLAIPLLLWQSSFPSAASLRGISWAPAKLASPWDPVPGAEPADEIDRSRPSSEQPRIFVRLSVSGVSDLERRHADATPEE